MDLNRLKLVLARFWWIVPLLVGGALTATWVWVQKQPATFTSVATVEVAQQAVRIMKVEDVRTENSAGLDYITTVVEGLTTNQVAIGAAKQLGWLDKDFAGLPESTVAAVVKSRYVTRWRKGSRFIDVIATESDGTRARDLALAVVQTYLKEGSQGRERDTTNAAEDLLKQSEDAKAKLQESERKLADYKIQKGSVSIDGRQNMIMETVRQLTAEANDAEGLIRRLEADMAQLQKIDPKNIDMLMQVKSVAELPQVNDLRGKIDNQKALFSGLKLRYLSLHPKYQAAANEIADLEASLQRTVRESTTILEGQFQSAQSRAAKAKEAVKAKEDEANQMDKEAAPFRIMQSEVETDRKMFDSIITRYNEIKTQGESRVERVPVQLKDQPIVPSAPSGPNKKQAMVKFGVLSLLAALAILFLIDRMDQSVRSVDATEIDLGLTVLAVVPDERADKKMSGHIPIVEHPSSFQAEAYRTLRTSLSLMGDESTRRLFLVTSALPAEGKTRTSCNLALSFAQQGFRTLLIDADLRRPSVAKTLFADQMKGEGGRLRDEHEGLGEILSGLAQPHQVMRDSPIDGLKVITAGGRCPNPAELLAAPIFQLFLQSMAQQFDRIIIDTSPVNSVSDALPIARLVHGVILVIRGAHTARNQAKKAIDSLRSTGCRLCGVVINRLPAKLYGYYGYYRYDADDPYIKNSGYVGRGSIYDKSTD